MSGGTTLATFEAAYARAAPFTLLPRDRCEQIWKLALDAPTEGDFVEVGVYRGGSAMLLRAAAPDRPIDLFDTFEGHPGECVGEHDSSHHYVGRYADTNAVEVMQRVGGNVCASIGRFPGRLFCDGWPWKRPIALAHVDVDLYQSTKDALNIITPLLVPGGIIVCDDFLEDDCPGVRKAIEEHLCTTSAQLSSDITTAGQAVLRRLA